PSLDALLPQHRPDTREFAAQRTQLVAELGLAHRPLQPQTEDPIVEVACALLEFGRALGAQFGELFDHLHDTFSSAKRVAKRVFIGSFADASRIAALASAAGMPSISNRMRPGLMTATQPSGEPLPLPMRVSCGFLVTGLSGNTRIQTLPPRLMNRVIATRAASICRSVSQQGSRAFRPKSPNDTSEPRHAFPAIRPRCCFRNFTFFGINISGSPKGRCAARPGFSAWPYSYARAGGLRGPRSRYSSSRP